MYNSSFTTPEPEISYISPDKDVPILNSGVWLIVKGLPFCVLESEIKHIFENVGPVAQICFQLGPEPLGFRGEVFIFYRDHADAVTALWRYSGARILGKECQVYLTRTGPLDNQGGCCCICINNLPNSTTRPRLRDLLSIYGHVKSAEICRKKNETLGYVTYASPISAVNAVHDLHRRALFDWPVSAHLYFGVVPATQEAADRRKFTELYVELPRLYNSAALQEHMSRFGRVEECRVSLDAEGRSLETGFVRFHEFEAAERALLTINKIRAKWGNHLAFPAAGEFTSPPDTVLPPEQTYGTLVLVRNLSPTTTHFNLRRLFSRFGLVLDGRVENCQAYFSYFSREEALIAQHELDGEVFNDFTLCVRLACQDATPVRHSSSPVPPSQLVSFGRQSLDSPTPHRHSFSKKGSVTSSSSHGPTQACYEFSSWSSDASSSDSPFDEMKHFGSNSQARFPPESFARLSNESKERLLKERMYMLLSAYADLDADDIVEYLTASLSLPSLMELVNSPTRLRSEADRLLADPSFRPSGYS